jgi:hypothetical protein
MPITYDRIATTTLGTATSSVTFSSIPATYTDLVLITSSTNNSGTSPSNITFRFNSDTTTNYSTTVLTGNGSTTTSTRATSDTVIYSNWLGGGTSGEIVTSVSQIMNYANTTTFKTVLSRYTNATAEVTTSVGLWRKTPEAINSITILSGAREYKSGSTFSIYGIKAA